MYLYLVSIMELLQLAKICEITFSDTDLVLLMYNQLLVLILPTFLIFFSVLSDALCSRQLFFASVNFVV